jgi:hypothetical protein
VSPGPSRSRAPRAATRPPGGGAGSGRPRGSGAAAGPAGGVAGVAQRRPARREPAVVRTQADEPATEPPPLGRSGPSPHAPSSRHRRDLSGPSPRALPSPSLLTGAPPEPLDRPPAPSGGYRGRARWWSPSCPDWPHRDGDRRRWERDEHRSDRDGRGRRRGRDHVRRDGNDPRRNEDGRRRDAPLTGRTGAVVDLAVGGNILGMEAWSRRSLERDEGQATMAQVWTTSPRMRQRPWPAASR